MKAYSIFCFLIVHLHLCEHLNGVPNDVVVQQLIEKNEFLDFKGKPVDSLLDSLNLSEKSLWDHSFAFRYAVKRYKISEKLELFIEAAKEGETETIISAKIYRHNAKKYGYNLLDEESWKKLGLLLPVEKLDKDE
jgi:hypothetical protein